MTISGRMKVMIAYDGSASANVAIKDLVRAGLAHDSEVLLTTVVDPSESRTSISEFDLISAASRRMDAVFDQARHQEERAIEDARFMVTGVAADIRRRFPEWTVRFEVLQGKPADQLLEKAASWEPDLIVAGTHGRSTIGRFLLGSVSQPIVEQAACSVRVAREGFEKTEASPVELLIGATNPADAKLILESIGRRVWNSETRVRIVVVDSGPAVDPILPVDLDGTSIYENAAEPLAAAGLQISARIESGDPKSIWGEAAEALRADAVFVAGNNKNDSGLDVLGLIADAKCTVEIVR